MNLLRTALVSEHIQYLPSHQIFSGYVTMNIYLLNGLNPRKATELMRSKYSLRKATWMIPFPSHSRIEEFFSILPIRRSASKFSSVVRICPGIGAGWKGFKKGSCSSRIRSFLTRPLIKSENPPIPSSRNQPSWKSGDSIRKCPSCWT